MMPLLRGLRPSLLVPLLALAACGGGAEPAGGLVHLELRREDGSSHTRALDEAVARISTRLDGSEDGPWRLVETPQGPALTLAGPIDAELLRRIELEASFPSPTQVDVKWPLPDGGEGFLVTSLMNAELTTRHRLQLGGRKGWNGTIERLSLRLTEPGEGYKLDHIRLAADSPDPGWEPLDGDRGDWGLVALGQEAHRAWPASLGVPLVARAPAPAGARLRVLAAPARRPRAPWTFRVLAREAGGGDWTEAAAREVDGTGQRWVELEADLAAFAGDEVELRFLVEGEAPGVDAPRLDAYWASPALSGERPADRRPNVVLVTLDTTRGDVLGKGWTPNLDRLAQRGTLFSSAYATTNSTIPSHASIFTGLPLEEHGAVGNRHAFQPQNRTLAERLRGAGYHTAAAVSVSLLRPGFGFGQGFERFELPHEDAFRDGAPATDAACGWIDEWSAQDTPFFLWLHLFDPHTPYGPPDDFVRDLLAERSLIPPPRRVDPATSPEWDVPPTQLDFVLGTTNRDRVIFEYYLGIAYADHLVGRLLEALERGGVAEDTVVAVTSDHGESLGEREYWYEHANLYPEVVHVPLILAGRGVPAGRSVDAPVSLIDLFPTLLGHLALAPEPELAGADLLALARGEAAPERRIWFQLSGRKQAGFRDDDQHFIATLEDGLFWISGAEPDEAGQRVPSYTTEPGGTNHLYELSDDPELQRDLGAEQEKRAADLADEVRRWLSTRKAALQTRRELTAEEEAELRNLGYAGDGK
ncbi:MAG: sulfatase [Planctomycetota bacterium]